MKFESVSQNIIEKTIKAGATDCDVVLAKGFSKSVSYRLGKVEDIEESNGSTFGIRALIGNKQAFISSSDDDENNIDKLIQRLIQMTKLAPEDETACLGDPNLYEKEIQNLNLVQNNPTDTTKLIEMAKQCEESALEIKGITNSEGSGSSFSESEFFIANNKGFNGGYRSSINSISCSVIAGEGQLMERDYDYAVSRHIDDLDSPSKVGKSSAKKAIQRLSPRKIESCKTPVIFDKRISDDLIGYLASAVSGNSIARGTSFLKDSLNKQIFSKDINIIDDPKIIKGLGSRPFDGEGLKTNKKEIVQNGVLKTWLLNTSTAKKLNLVMKNFLSKITILADKFFCIMESSIWVPTDLGSNATLTPVPKIPFDATPAHPVKNIPINKKINILFFIFNFKTIIINLFFWNLAVLTYQINYFFYG